MGRGGKRKGAGRKSGWRHSETQTIRVPKIFAAQILEYARQLDAGNDVLSQDSSDSETESNLHLDIPPGQTTIFDFLESGTESKYRPLHADELNTRLQFPYPGQIMRMKRRFKDDPQGFINWSKKREKKRGLEVIGWRFDEATPFFYPVEPPSDGSN